MKTKTRRKEERLVVDTVSVDECTDVSCHIILFEYAAYHESMTMLMHKAPSPNPVP
jgi:hypothetical protein